MILSVFFKDRWHYGERVDASRLITEVMEELQGEGGIGRSYSPGEDAWFLLADQRCGNEPVEGSNLRVAVNQRTGHGALVWFVNPRFRKGGIHDHVWVSDNPEPPDLDPRVVSDPCYPLFHDPSSALPIPRIRAALEEFCRAGTGERPECVSGNLQRPRRYHRGLLRAFYLSAFASLRSCPASKRFYERKRAEGKGHKQALLALARRRANVLWAMIRDGACYQATPPVTAAARQRHWEVSLL